MNDYKKLDLSIVIKTFLRPHCLENLLNSISKYQNAYKLNFKEIIIIDDSDEENQKLNKEVVEKAVDINIDYQQFEFNSLAICKGRNQGIDAVKTPYFLLFDDDFVLDEKCDIEKNLTLLKEKNLDILGGHYRDIQSLEDTDYKPYNWLGFIKENDAFDTCFIFPNFLPEFCYCDITQNFYLAKTDKIKELRYPEDMPTLEHNVFFLRAKQKGLKVASTNQLWTKHLHLENKNKNYSGFRNRKIVNPINKPVLGYLITDNTIHHFKDYLHVRGEEFTKPDNSNSKYTITLNLLLFKVTIYFAFLKAIAKLTEKIKSKAERKKIAKLEFIKNKAHLEIIKQEYPKVLSTTETLKKIVEEKKSIARFGDGELKLVAGEGLGIKGHPGEYQVFDETLSQRLKEILKTPQKNCLVGIDRFKDPYNDEKYYQNGLSYWEIFWLKYWDKLKDMYNKSYEYSCTATTRVSVFKENDLSEIKKIWQGRKILFVVGENSHFVEEERLFDNIEESAFFVTKGKSAFSEYENIINKIKEYDKDWLIFLSLGPTATVLAYDLAQEGYQALDMGHLPNCYLQAIEERESPEKEHWKSKQYLRKEGVYQK